jgi:hypothetical protein
MGGVSAQVIIAAMITPALLIMASGSLIASALIRMGRVVDHVRKLAESDRPVTPAVLRSHEPRADRRRDRRARSTQMKPCRKRAHPYLV